MPNPRKPQTFIPSKYTRYTVVKHNFEYRIEGNFRMVEIFVYFVLKTSYEK